MAVARLLLVPARLLLESLQMISSIQRNIRVQWPNIFRLLFGKIEVLNFDFFTQPSTSCSVPDPSLLLRFNVVIVGVFCLMCYVGLVYGVTLFWLRYVRGKPAVEQRDLLAAALSQTIFLLTATCAAIRPAAPPARATA